MNKSTFLAHINRCRKNGFDTARVTVPVNKREATREKITSLGFKIIDEITGEHLPEVEFVINVNKG